MTINPLYSHANQNTNCEFPSFRNGDANARKGGTALVRSPLREQTDQSSPNRRLGRLAGALDEVDNGFDVVVDRRGGEAEDAHAFRLEVLDPLTVALCGHSSGIDLDHDARGAAVEVDDVVAEDPLAREVEVIETIVAKSLPEEDLGGRQDSSPVVQTVNTNVGSGV